MATGLHNKSNFLKHPVQDVLRLTPLQKVTCCPLAFLCWVRWRRASDSRGGWAASQDVTACALYSTRFFLGKTVGVSHTSRWGIWGHQFYVSVKTSVIKLYFIACTPKQAAVLGLEGLQCGPQGLLLPTRLLPAALLTARVSMFRRSWGRSLLGSPVKKV